MSDVSTFCRDKIWIITGGASGIGRSMALSIGRRRGIVWAVDISESRLKDLQDLADQEGIDLFTAKCDVTNDDDVNKIISSVKAKHKRFDVWINNAGMQNVGSFLEQPEEAFDRVMELNLHSVVRSSRKVAKLFEDQGGGIVLNMASQAGHMPAPFMAAYVTSKHAVVGFSRALAAEFDMCDSPVRVAFASPGFVDTEIIQKGQKGGFPQWLSWMLTSADECAEEIISKLASGDNEIRPTASALLMRLAYSIAPKTTVRGSKMLMASGLKDVVLNRFQVPRSLD